MTLTIIGLTGSIGMGKSAAAAYLRAMGVPVYDADAAVHAVYQPGGAAVVPISKVFPEAIVKQGVDRTILSRMAGQDSTVLKELETIVHPIVREIQDRFLTSLALRRSRLAVLDIPLLFETGAEDRCDTVFVVSSPSFIQRARVLQRPEMSVEKFEMILARQTPDAEKRRRADHIIPSHQGWNAMYVSLCDAIKEVQCLIGHHWPFNPARVPMNQTLRNFTRNQTRHRLVQYESDSK
jgi:dephospho-CoA kinase